VPHSNVARRYAEGVFELAQEEHDLEGWRAEMGKLDALLRDDVLTAAFANPAVSMARRLELAGRLAPELKPGAANLLRLLIEHHRTSEMPAIREEFDRLADEAEGIVHVTMTTASELSEQDRQRYERELAKRLQRQVRAHYQRDAALIGGATVQIGDRVIDGSVRTQLQRLRQELAG
jgi:F-type H+-transporting ATPase subunit delta